MNSQQGMKLPLYPLIGDNLISQDKQSQFQPKPPRQEPGSRRKIKKPPQVVSLNLRVPFSRSDQIQPQSSQAQKQPNELISELKTARCFSRKTTICPQPSSIRALKSRREVQKGRNSNILLNSSAFQSREQEMLKKQPTTQKVNQTIQMMPKQRPSLSSNHVNSSVPHDNVNAEKIQSFITNSNIKRFDKYRNKVQQNYKSQLSQAAQTKSSLKNNSEDEEPFELYFDQQPNIKFKQSSMFQSIELQNLVQMEDLPKLDSIKRFESLDERENDYFKTINVQTIQDGNNQKIEVSITIPMQKSKNRFARKSNSVINTQQFCQVGGGPSTIFQTKKHSQNLCKPPKVINEKEQQSSRREYQTQIDTKSISENSTSTISRRTTRPQPFNLSRSNSRRAKHILIKEKKELEQKEIEDIEMIKKEQSQKQRNIPVTNYVPKLVVFKSTKTLTEFQEFSFNSARFSKSRKEPLFNEQCDIKEEQESQTEQSNSSFLKNLLREHDLNEDIFV